VLPPSISSISFFPCHPVSAYVYFLIFPSLLFSITCVRRQFLRKMWPIQLAFPLVIVIGCSSLLALCNTSSHFERDRFKWYSPSFSSTKFQNFPCISDLLPEIFVFQHHTKLCFIRSISLVSSCTHKSELKSRTLKYKIKRQINM